MKLVRLGTGLAGLPLLLAGCLVDTSTDGVSDAPSAVAAPGALVKMDMSSTVGVFLDDIPAGPAREAAAAEALAKPASFWVERAERQVKLTFYRLIFRAVYYSSTWSQNPNVKGPLPLPPKSVWGITLSGGAQRSTQGGHDIVQIPYAFTTHLLSDPASTAASEPALGTIGGTWDEGFNLPVDPELLLQRTGYACMDEDEYPPGSVFEENTYYFFDDTCHVESQGSASCHITEFPSESCVESMTKHTGIVKPTMHFTRVPWSASLANSVRVGTITNQNGADLEVVQNDMVEENRTAYKFFAPGSCELEEGVIASLGWRRLLRFSATVRNNGTGPVHIGDLTDPNNPWLTSHVFEFSPCHGHYHFSHYGNFDYAGAPGSKRAFCLEETNRFHNSELSPLTAPHQSCSYQGIQAGWGDEYEFGIPGQWVDVTDISPKKAHDLVFNSNPDAFLCEGAPVLDANGVPIFDPTSFLSAAGEPLSRIRCTMPSTWHDNNVGSLSVQLPPAGGSYVTQACSRGQVGPRRDCGFTDRKLLKSCVPGSSVQLSCSASGPSQVVRVCERSAALGVGVACTLRESAANTIVGSAPTPVTFTCPSVRDAANTGGYSLYQAPVAPSQAYSAVTCTGF